MEAREKGKRVGVPKDSKAFATTAANKATAPNGAQQEKAEVVAK